MDKASTRNAWGVTKLSDGLFYLAQVRYDAKGMAGAVTYSQPAATLYEAMYNFKVIASSDGLFDTESYE